MQLPRLAMFATVSTLLFVPVVYAGVHDRLIHRRERRHPSHDGVAPNLQET